MTDTRILDPGDRLGVLRGRMVGARHRQDDARRAGFSLDKGQWGAWEPAARYSVLDLNDNEFSTITADRVRGGEQAIWTLGVNWFLNPTLRFSLDWLDVSVDRLDGAGAQIGQDFQALNLRSQFAF